MQLTKCYCDRCKKECTPVTSSNLSIILENNLDKQYRLGGLYKEVKYEAAPINKISDLCDDCANIFRCCMEGFMQTGSTSSGKA